MESMCGRVGRSEKSGVWSLREVFLVTHTIFPYQRSYKAQKSGFGVWEGQFSPIPYGYFNKKIIIFELFEKWKMNMESKK